MKRIAIKDSTETQLMNMVNMAGKRAITVEGYFRDKPINILVDTGCDIVCVSSQLMPRNEWKKVHKKLIVCGFNGNPVQCSAKVDLDWKMGDIKSGWKNAWVLPDMI